MAYHDGLDWQLWANIRARYDALSLRANALGTYHFPTYAPEWERGTITGATATGIYVTGSHDPAGNGWWNHPRDGFGRDLTPYVPTLFDFVIDDPEPNKCFRIPIGVNTTYGTNGFFADVQAWVNAGWISSPSDLATTPAKKYAIIQSGAPFYSDRWPAQPLPNVNTTSTSIVGNGTTVTVAYTAIPVGPNQFATGRTVEITGAVPSSFNGHYTITRTGLTTFTYVNATAGTATSQCSIKLNGVLGDPIAKWYAGYMLPHWSHSPEYPTHSWGTGAFGAAMQVNMPVDSYRYTSSDDGSTCTIPAFDVDVAYNPYGGCPPTRFMSVKMYTTIRGLQDAIEQMCGQFVPYSSNSYEGAAYVPTFSPATLISGSTGPQCEFNWEIRTQSLDTTVTPNVWRMTTTAGSPDAQGTTADPNWTPASVGWSYNSTTQTYYQGTNLRIVNWTLSPSWTRVYPREVQYMFYPKAVFIPDTKSGGAGVTVCVDPPNETDGIGRWEKRAVSTGYCTVTNHGYMADNALPFVEGEVARYIGDNWQDAPYGLAESYDPTVDNPTIAYEDRKWDGSDSLKRGNHADRIFSGKVLSGTASSLVSDQNWWPAGALITHSGTATGGDTTHCTDSSKATSLFWQDANRFVDFVIEVRTSTSPDVWERSVITASTATTITFSPAISTSASGKAYRIREPRYELNRWAGHELRITYGNDTVVSTTINHNDDTTLWFGPVATAVNSDCTFQIIEHIPGTVWLRESGKWIAPATSANNVVSGKPCDPRTGKAWPTDQWTIAPTVVTTGGKFRRGDYVTDTIYAQLDAAIAALRWTFCTVGTTAQKSVIFSVPSDGGGLPLFVDQAAINAYYTYNYYTATSIAVDTDLYKVTRRYSYYPYTEYVAYAITSWVGYQNYVKRFWTIATATGGGAIKGYFLTGGNTVPGGPPYPSGYSGSAHGTTAIWSDKVTGDCNNLITAAITCYLMPRRYSAVFPYDPMGNRDTNNNLWAEDHWLSVGGGSGPHCETGYQGSTSVVEVVPAPPQQAGGYSCALLAIAKWFV